MGTYRISDWGRSGQSTSASSSPPSSKRNNLNPERTRFAGDRAGSARTQQAGATVSREVEQRATGRTRTHRYVCRTGTTESRDRRATGHQPNNRGTLAPALLGIVAATSRARSTTRGIAREGRYGATSRPDQAEHAQDGHRVGDNARHDDASLTGPWLESSHSARILDQGETVRSPGRHPNR